MKFSNILNITEFFSEPIIILEKGIIEHINSAASEFFRMNSSQICGKNFTDFLPEFSDNKLELINHLISNLNSEHENFSFDCKLKNPFDYKEPIRISVQKLDENYTFVKFDTTKIILEKMNSRFKAEKEKLNIALKDSQKMASKMKKTFLDQVSHEIRTPLSAILSFASLIKEDLKKHIPPDLMTGFEVISRGGERVIRTVDLMLNMSEILTNTFRYRPQKLDFFSDIFFSIFDKNKKYAEEKEIRFEYTNKCTSDTIFADEFMLNHIVDNIINNAIKFTDAGSVEISMFNSDAGNLIFQVKDTGIGISENYLSRIFEVFTQEDEGVRRKYDGNGLGLSLVKKYCDINNIKLDLKSKKNFGTTVTLEFEKFTESNSESTTDLKQSVN